MENPSVKPASGRKKIFPAVLCFVLAFLILAGTLVSVFMGLFTPAAPDRAFADHLEALWQDRDASGFMKSILLSSDITADPSLNEDPDAESSEEQNPADIESNFPQGALLKAIMKAGNMSLEKSSEAVWQMKLRVPDLNDYLTHLDPSGFPDWEALYEKLIDAIREGDTDKITAVVPVSIRKINDDYYLISEPELIDALYGGMLTYTENLVRTYYTDLLDEMERSVQ